MMSCRPFTNSVADRRILDVGEKRSRSAHGLALVCSSTSDGWRTVTFLVWPRPRIRLPCVTRAPSPRCRASGISARIRRQMDGGSAPIARPAREDQSAFAWAVTLGAIRRRAARRCERLCGRPACHRPFGQPPAVEIPAELDEIGLATGGDGFHHGVGEERKRFEASCSARLQPCINSRRGVMLSLGGWACVKLSFQLYLCCFFPFAP